MWFLRELSEPNILFSCVDLAIKLGFKLPLRLGRRFIKSGNIFGTNGGCQQDA